MWLVLARIFTKGRYLAFSLVLFFTGLSLVLVLPNWDLVLRVFLLDEVSIWSKFEFVLSLYGSVATNFTILSAFIILLLLVLFSINTSLLIFYIRRVRKLSTGHKRLKAGSAIGAVAGLLGIGCAACGSVILAGVATSFGIAGLLLYLPLNGGELVIVGIILLMITIYYLAKKINDPLICEF